MARTVVGVVICGDGAVAVFGVASSGPAWHVGLAVVLIGMLLCLQVFHFSRPGARLHTRYGYALLLLQAALAYLPLIEFKATWVGLPSFLAANMLLMLPSLPAWLAFGAIVASMAWVQDMISHSVLDMLYTGLSVALFGLDVYLLTWLASLVAELHATRGELAQLAVSEERLRFARDLHDLLGLSLSAITLKGELTHRLLHRAPAEARRELGEIVDMARRALADVRSIASGYQELSLEEEAHSAESVLAASNVDVRMDLDYADLPPDVRTVLSTVLREAVTNVLRHSKAEYCEMVVRQTAEDVVLEVLNDGVVDDPTPRDPNSGSGIRNVSDRVHALGGATDAGLDQEGSFRLRVAIPLTADAQRRVPRRRWDRTPVPAAELPGTPTNARTARWLVGVAFLGMCVSAVLHLLYQTRDFWTVAANACYLVALLAIQLGYTTRSTARPRPPMAYTLLFVQACLIYLPLLQFGRNWVSLPGFLLGSALLVLSPLLGWTVFAATVGSVVWQHLATTGQPLDVAFNAVATIITGFEVFGLTLLTKLVTELAGARVQLAQMAVSQERLRFARDLHDLLGLGLSTIIARAESTRRQLDGDAATGGAGLVEILGMARKALSDVRSVASGYRELSLDKEIQSALAVLTAADLRVEVAQEYDELPTEVSTLLAVVLREGVTNVLRHSSADHCEIAIHQDDCRVSLEIVNDGVDENPPDTVDSREGGMGGLADRVARLGGELHAMAEPGGRFRLSVSLPA